MSTSQSISKRLNVLVYAGKGTTPESVSHALFTLRRHLTPYYAVLPVASPSVLISEPWAASTALLVIPGGADLGYCSDLNGEGNRRIRRFVENGGAYLGFCAGGYYGSARCEFEVGSVKKGMEVVGSRELAFFPGICRGAAFKGFEYASEKGARAVKLKTVQQSSTAQSPTSQFKSYYNGGGVFVDADKSADTGIEVLAEYEDDLDVDHGAGKKAAVVYCKIGDGAAILTGPHPEFASVNLKAKSETSFFPDLVQEVRSNDDVRNDFIATCLSKLGLKINLDQNIVPQLSALQITCSYPSAAREIYQELTGTGTTSNDTTIFKDEQDNFEISINSALNMDELKQSLPETEIEETSKIEDKIVDHDEIPKELIIHEKSWPSLVVTPQFDHALFYKYQEIYAGSTKGADPDFGHWLLYGEVVTSTNSLLEKNPKLLSKLPSGLTAVAGLQIAGRGRGTNVWISPPGQLMFSIIVKHELSLMTRAPVIFLQYLAAIAVVEGVKTYGGAYDKIPIKIKWPNDVYVLEPSFPQDSKVKPPRSSYVKICGILVNSSYHDNSFNAVVGIGLNTTNALPTTSIAALVEKLPAGNLPALSKERLLARIIITFSVLYGRFCKTGFDSHLQGLYYKHWLHSEQEVTLESEGGTRAIIKGITSDGGMLVAEEVSGARRKIHLQSDFNSFDFLQGLVRRKT